MEHLEQHKLISVSQHGFLPGRSCLTNLLAYFESVTKHVDSGLPVDTVYLDFAKAFDKVPHRRLLMKLKVHGIDRWCCFRMDQKMAHRQKTKGYPEWRNI